MLLYLVDLFINNLKTKFNNFFLQNDFKYKKNSQLLLKKFLRLQKFYLLARKSDGHGHGLWVIARQIVIVGNSKRVTKTIIRLSVGGYSQVT